MRNKTIHTSKQIAHAERWIAEWHIVNKETLENMGILVSEVRRQYNASTPFPMGLKSFSPLLKKLTGVESVYKNNKWTYILLP